LATHRNVEAKAVKQDIFLKQYISDDFMANVTFKTYGCSNNFSESEAMAGLLEKGGHTVSDDQEQADVVVFNMCSVKGPSVNDCLNKVKEIKDKKVVVAGCVPRNIIKKLKEINPQISIVSTHHIDEIKNVVESDEPKEFSLYDKKVKLGFPKRRKNPAISIVPILSGCNDHCSYCSTVLVKGPTFSYPQERIIQEIENSIKDGCKEIWLTSQDNGAYMTDQGKYGLANLLKNIVQVDGFFALRLGMTNPTYISEMIDELIEVFKHEKMYKFIHLPVQAGNNQVLKKMKRRYTAEQYKEIVSKLKSAIPDMNIATDIICGFPEETDEQFQDTIRLIEETKPDSVFISRFQLRQRKFGD